MKMDRFDDILEKRINGGRLSLEEGVSLYSCDLLRLGRAAHQVKEKMFPEKRVTFIVDRNISYTNACVVDCDFCAFYRSPGHAEAYTMTHDEVFKKIEELVALGGTQALIQGGVNPDLPIDYYLDLIRAVRQKFPTVHVHSFSVVEMDMIARKNRIPLRAASQSKRQILHIAPAKHFPTICLQCRPDREVRVRSVSEGAHFDCQREQIVGVHPS